MKENNELLLVLLDALPIIAKLSSGPAAVTDMQGKRIKTVDSLGNELQPEDEVLDIARLAGQTGKAQVSPSQIIEGAEAWALPLRPYVLAACNADLMMHNKVLYDSLREALPLISRVVGGETVLFDREGRRLYSVDYHGKVNEAFIGRVSKAARQAMETGKPFIGESLSVMGATAVRIPISPWLGIGMNDEQSVKYKRRLLSEVRKFQSAKYRFDDIIGNSRCMEEIKQTIRSISKSVSTVLLLGETGTGKELFAQAIHNESNRRSQPFIAINCGALPENLIESQLFGYMEGSFTGAKKSGSAGVFEQANGGTVFLDELGEMNLDLQKKLLRVLQERVVTRLGGHESIPLDVRIVASTNRDIRAMIREKVFREDLYFRLSVMEFVLPPLRQRQEDIPELIQHFIEMYNQIMGRNIKGADEGFKALCCGYGWPGNVRELQNYVEYAMNLTHPNEEFLSGALLPPKVSNSQGVRIFAEAVLCEKQGGRQIGSIAPKAPPWPLAQANQDQMVKDQAAQHPGGYVPASWPSGMGQWEKADNGAALPGGEQPPLVEGPLSRESFQNALNMAERTTILEALKQCGGNKKQCAALLNISTTTLWRKMKRLGIKDEKFWY